MEPDRALRSAPEHGPVSGDMAANGSRRPARLPISAYVICKDEEARIEGCLRSLAACAEIIVVDSGSTDGTLAIVQRLADGGLPIRLLHQSWLGYAAQKQFALEQATQPWCLNLDADELLDADLQQRLAALLDAEDHVAGWRLRRLPCGAGGRRAPAGIYAKPILRLVRRGRARYDQDALVHEGLILDGTMRDARSGLILHDNHLPFADQLRKEIVYAGLKAKERVRSGRSPSRFRLVFNPPISFLRIFVFYRWFLAGWPGFVYAVTTAIYAFSVEAMHFELARGSGREQSRP